MWLIFSFLSFLCSGKVLTTKNLPYGEIFSASPAKKTFIQWATQMQRNGGTVSHTEAFHRENYVVEMVNKGIWPPEAYTEYQTFTARSGNVDSVRLLLEYGLQPGIEGISKEKNRFANTFARNLLSCNISMIQHALLRSPGSENYLFVDGNTPLILAVIANCTKGIQILLEQGADSSLSGSHGLTPFLVAAAFGYIEIADLLHAKNPDDLFHHHPFANTSALHMAAEMGQTKMISWLCGLGINSTTTRTILDGTALHIAAQVGKWESVGPLIRAPCSLHVDILMSGDTTPLYLSAQHGHSRTVKALLRYGANASYAMPVTSHARINNGLVANSNHLQINSAPANGATAIHVASENGHLKVVEILLGEVSPDIMAEIGVAPLHLATQYSRLSVIKLLIKYNATVDLPSQIDGSSPLYIAVAMKNFDIVKTLLDGHASPLARRGSSNLSPLMLSLTLPDTKISELLFRFIPHCICANHITAKECYLSDLTLWEAILLAPENSVTIKFKYLDLIYRYFHGCDVSSLRTADDSNVLHVAVSTGRVSFLKQILRFLEETQPESIRALAQQQSVHGLNPLHTLFLADHTNKVEYVAIIKLLLNAGASVDSTLGETLPTGGNKDSTVYHELRGATALYLACSSERKGMEEVVETLMNHGANPNIHLANEYTPLVAAIDRSTPEVVRLLLFGNSKSTSSSMRADPNLAGGTSSTYTQSPLLFALIKGRVDVARLLLDAGADCHLTIVVHHKTSSSVENLTLPDIARRRRDFDMLQLLTTNPACRRGNDEL